MASRIPSPVRHRPLGLEHPQPSPHRPLGVIFVRQGVAEVDQEPIAEVLGDMPLEAGDHFGAGGLIGLHHLAQLFRVELTGECRGVHQITEQDGELPAFGVCGARCGKGCHLSRVVFLLYGLLRRLRGGSTRCRLRFSGPHQHSATVVDRQVVDLKQFLLEGCERLLIEMKLEHEGAVGHAPATLEHGDRLVQDLLKGHRPPPEADAACRRRCRNS
jgi:hypothetical protein